MAKKMPQRTLRIHRRPDGRFVTRNERPTDSPLGVDSSLSQAMGTATREATAISREAGCRVIIEVEQANGKWKRETAMDPPRSARA